MVFTSSYDIFLNDANYYPKTSQDYGTWLTDLFDGLGIRQAFVTGSSMDGWITHPSMRYQMNPSGICIFVSALLGKIDITNGN